ncbi:MAG: SseB family protein [Alphaproteobacteria bacterium]|nr:SseB family protein [Alphaproteobacteria bacterium]
MSFVPENPLEEALLRGTRSPMARREFFRMLLVSDLVVVGQKSEDGRLKIVSSERDGRKYVSAFTSAARLKNHVHKTVNTLTMNGRMLLERTRGVTVLINPSEEYPAELTPELIAEMLETKDVSFKTLLN